MPEEFERLKTKITASMRKSHPESGKWSEERKSGYVFGTLRKLGWVKGKDGHMHKTK